MSHPNPNRVSFDEVLRLVDELTTEQQDVLRRRLDKSWTERWDEVVSKIRERAQSLPPLSDEEILSEVKAIREAGKDRQS